MKKLGYMLLTCSLMLSGCATVRSDFAGNKTYNDIKSIKLDSAAIGSVEYGKVGRFKITTNSPLIDSPSQKGRYELISVRGTQGQSFLMTIAGLCDCLGFRKWSIVPYTYLIDGSGNTISTGTFGSPNAQVLKGTFPESREYYVMVVADSASEGRKVGQVNAGLAIPGAAYVPNALSLSMTSHPTGSFLINFQKNQ